MKNVIILALLLMMTISISGCGKLQEAQNHNTEIEEAAGAVQDSFDELSDDAPDIIKSGTYSGNSVSIEGFSNVKLDSWYLGYSGHILTDGDEYLCLKFVIENLSNESKPIYELLRMMVYVDGVSQQISADHFFSNGISSTSNIRPGAEAEYYIMTDCSVDGTHTVDIDIFDNNVGDIYIVSGEAESIGTFAFEIS